ncbi:conserved hypothetical protein [Flavobacterium psychrophilum]|uniref:DUF3347 domain-containing protein n=1 Tax=Flavobacterium psychrophilum TaxID=96345 RepID=UPI000B7C566E|nr:DUF3347 domain-containing protein [Flavobacterium psychrophilum]SNB43936.1 conserved hypothetical protein [Flavobacterium psychrophilum]
MKNIILSAVAIAFVLVSCNQKNKQTETVTSEKTETASQLYACSMHPEVTGKKGEKCSKCGMELTEPVKATTEKIVATETEPVTEITTTAVAQTPFSINEIISNYLTLKNALTKDDAKGAGVAGKTLYATFNAVNVNSIDAKLKKEYLDIVDDAKEHAEHIGANADKLEHQREHFVMLSKDINDLIKLFGTKQKLYQDFCPMANDGKGAIWISEVKDIKNPYQGTKMLTCGSMKKAL